MLSGVTQEHTRFAVEIDTAATRKQLPALRQKRYTADTTCYEIVFITAEGKAAKRVTGLKGHYESRLGDGYVRVKASYSCPEDSIVYHAFTQPWILAF
jgi:nucleoside 2-deoxyribosyltransferase